MSTKHEHKTVYTADNKDFKQKSKQVQSSSEKLAQKMKAVGVAAAAAFSVKKIIQWGKSTVKAFNKQIQAEKKLEAAIRANGEAVESTMIEYKRWASEMQELSTVGDETTLEMLSVAQSMGVTGESAKTAVKEAISLAKAMGMSETSAIRYTAALADGNSTMLARYLPSLRSVEGEAARTAKAHELLGNMFSQVTAEAREGLGPLEQLSNSWGDFQERMGKKLIPILGKAAIALKDLITPKESKNLAIEKRELNELIGVITNTNIQTEERIELIAQLQKNYPDFLSNLDVEKVTNEELRDRLIEVNKAYDDKIQVAVRQELIAKKSKQLARLVDAEYIALKRLTWLQSDAGRNLGANRDREIKATEAVIKKNQDKRKSIEDEIDATIKLLKGKEKLLTIENGLINAAENNKITTPDKLEGKAAINLDVGLVDTSKLAEGMVMDNREIAASYNLAERAAMAMGNAVAQASQQGVSSLKDLANVALQAAKEIIGAEIAQGIAAVVKSALISVPFPFNIAIAAAAGAGAQALFNSVVPSFAEGGAAYGPTLALVGEASGISKSNPEYIGTAAQLSKMGIAGQNGGTLTARVSKGDLLFILNSGGS